MRTGGNVDQHLDTRTALDFLEQRLDAAARRQVEEHLGRPCDACRERLRELGEILTTMRADRVGEVPRALHERAVAVFVPAKRSAPAPGLVIAIAELLFDSALQPLTAAARRSVGGTHRLRFRLGVHSLELEIEDEGLGMMSVRGRLEATDPRVWSIQLEAGCELRTIRPDAIGGFVVSGLPMEAFIMLLSGEGGRFRLPTIEP